MVVNEWLRSTVFFGLVFVTVANYGNEYLLFEHLYRISRRNVALRDGQRKFFFFGSKERFGIQPKRRGGRQVVCVCVYYLSDSLFFFPTRRCVSFTGVAALFAIRFSRVSLAYRSSCPVRPCVPVLPPHAVFLTWFQTRDQRKISSKPPPDIYEKKSPLPSLSLSLSNPKTFGNGGLRYRTALPRVCVASLTVSYLWESRLLSNLEGRKLGGGSLGGWG